MLRDSLPKAKRFVLKKKKKKNTEGRARDRAQ